ncbi:MAG TPA: hypothetical protein VJG90_04600 [Candidatus Nanoarchaeia archaeon]|nr:hypothetical protein [Candidatus Nanoarchaeia archaeon]
MRKRENLSIFKYFILIALLLLTGCVSQGGQPYKDVNYFTGTDGVTIQLIENAPAKIIDEESTFPVWALVQNKGSYDVQNQEGDPAQNVYVTIIKDNYFIQGTTEGYAAPFPIRGKSDAYPEGQFYTLDLGMYKASTIPGNFEKPETPLLITACYPYKTKLTQDVCIDVNTLNKRVQPCKSTETTFSGQGAPVVITKIEPNMQQLQGGFVRPTFKIYMDNKGKGQVISPTPSQRPPDQICALQGAQKDETDRVQIKAYLSDLQLDCGPEGTPDYIDIGSTQNWMNCYVTEEALRNQPARFGNRDNYKTTLRVELDYYYMITAEQKITLRHIQRFQKPKELLGLDLNGRCPFPWQYYDSQTDRCWNKCDYCGNPAINPKPAFCTSRPILGETYKIIDDFGCNCDQKTFESLFKRETWYYDQEIQQFKPFKLAVPGDLCPDDYGCCRPTDCSQYHTDPKGCSTQTEECTYCAKNSETEKASCINSKRGEESFTPEERTEKICKPLCGERSQYNEAKNTCEKPPKETAVKTETKTPTAPAP